VSEKRREFPGGESELPALRSFSLACKRTSISIDIVTLETLRAKGNDRGQFETSRLLSQPQDEICWLVSLVTSYAGIDALRSCGNEDLKYGL